jgi:transcriptional regulator with XRE-family HTH domain
MSHPFMPGTDVSQTAPTHPGDLRPKDRHHLAMKPETQHMLDVLKQAMRMLGFSYREIERKMGVSSSYLSRLFSGDIALRHDHVVEIAQAMGLEPGEIFRAAYPSPAGPPSSAAEKLNRAVQSFSSSGPFAGAAGATAAPARDTAAALPAAAGAAGSPEELESLMAKALRRFFKELSETGKVA